VQEGFVSMNYQDPGYPRCLQNFSAVLYITVLQDRKKEAKKSKTAFRQAGQLLLVYSTWASKAVMWYKKLI
jgi:hypothetical protein